jgi:uncharacterized membrane protein YgdD (TMEM256/DUF423 family)
MRLTSSQAFRAAALLGFLGVALGAFGAHWLKPQLVARGTLSIWEKAVFYHLAHAVVMLGLAGLRPFPVGAWRALGAGVILFSGSLYGWALSGVHWLVFVTPFGGLCFLAGWLWLAWRGISNSPETVEESGPRIH